MKGKIRYWGVTAWLVVIIAVNITTIIAHTFFADQILITKYESIRLHQHVLVLLSALNVVFAWAILQWKRWGFKGIIISVVLIFCASINLDLPAFPIMFWISGPIVLFILLQRPAQGTTTWDQLE